MNRYRVTYRDYHDAGCPTFDAVIRAYSAEDAIARFWATSDEDREWAVYAVVELPAA